MTIVFLALRTWTRRTSYRCRISRPNTLRSIIDHLKVSTDFEHLVYREAELDAIWTITGFFLANEADSSRREAVKDLHACVHKAHDLVADRRPAAAAMLLQAFL